MFRLFAYFEYDLEFGALCMFADISVEVVPKVLESAEDFSQISNNKVALVESAVLVGTDEF
jgi:hypothetical protein